MTRDMAGTVQSFTPCGDSLAALMAFVAQRSALLNVPRDTSLRLQLVAEELFTNTFRHGLSAGGEALVTVGIELGDAAEVALTYEDGAAAWDPLQQSAAEHVHLPLEQRPVGGLGVLLIGAMVERAVYERVLERNRVRVWLRYEGAGEL